MEKKQRLLLSHSTVDMYNQCGQKYSYAYLQQLQAKGEQAGIERGNTGHAFAEAFFNAIKDGAGNEQALHLGIIAASAGYDGPKMVALWARWVREVWPKLGWKIVEVEREYRLEINETLVFPFKVDLIVEWRGKLYVVDIKNLYDPYSVTVTSLLSQIPKYVGALRAMGIPIHDGIYCMFRTRKTDIDLFTNRVLELTNARINNSMREHILSMKEIENGGKQIVRTANKMNCDHCSFSELCIADLNGENTKYIREHSYEPNTYGYTEEVNDE